jgi:long-subunit fatty acid transport protein
MKKLVKCLAVAFFVLSASSLSYAKGIFIQPGARAAGYGQAFTAVADDLTAIFWNPAGLAYQKDTQAMMSAFYINYDATSNGPIFNKFQTSAILPFMAFSLPIDQSKKTILAAGIYISGGGGGKLEQLVAPDTYAKIEGQYSYMIYNVSLAREIHENLSVAVGVDLINMNEKNEITNLPPLNTDYSRSGYGVQGNVGVMYKPLKKLSTGIIFRSGSSISLSDVENKDKHFKYPMTIEGGFAYDLFDRLTFACAVAHTEYSWTSADYVDTTIIKVGAEYRATDKLSLLAGFYNDPNIINTSVLYDPSEEKAANVTNLNMYNMRYFNIGVGYKFTKSFNAVLLYSRSYTQEVSAIDPFIYSTEGIIRQTKYSYPINFVKIDMTYKFGI